MSGGRLEPQHSRHGSGLPRATTAARRRRRHDGSTAATTARRQHGGDDGTTADGGATPSRRSVGSHAALGASAPFFLPAKLIAEQAGL